MTIVDDRAASPEPAPEPESMPSAEPQGRGLVPGLANRMSVAHGLPPMLVTDEFCARLVAAFDDMLAPLVSTLDCLDYYFAPEVAPADFTDWLCSWVGADDGEGWTQAGRRALAARAVEIFRIRGTLDGLRDLIELYTDGPVEVSDSGGCVWSAAANSPLPGSAPATVEIRLPESARARLPMIERMVAANKPAHVIDRIDVGALPG